MNGFVNGLPPSLSPNPSGESLNSGLRIRMVAVMCFCIALGVALFTRAAYIQLGSDARLEKMAKRQFQSKVLIRPRRGLILDRNGEPLSANREADSLAANPSKIQNRKTLARLLSKALDLPAAKLTSRLTGGKEFVWIKRHLTEAEKNRLRKFRLIDSEGDLAEGLWLIKESQRVYPHGELAAHILGNVNVDSEGLEGVELWMNERMRGKIVSVSAIKDALGRPAFIDAAAAKNVQEGKDGESISLTLDASLQFAVEEELRNAVRKANARGGSVIVMNSVTGEVLAMANQPAFNPNDKSVPADRKRNRALTDGYEPGSTMKTVLLAGALSHGQKLTDQIWGELGQFKVQGKKISEAEAHEKFKWLSLKKIIQVSSNVGAAKLALKLGSDNYYNTLKSFGFGARTETGFPGEMSGILPARKTWQPLSLANFGFGQGLLVTPMQMLRSYAAFLNGGWLVQPTLLKTSGGPISSTPPRRIITKKVADQVLEALATVTTEGGTGLKANLPGYKVAGKTGTAQKVEPITGGYSRSKYVASFIGFALDVDPKIAIFTSIDEPHGIYYASETAAPLFREVLNAVANRFSLPTHGNVPPVVAAVEEEIKHASPEGLESGARSVELEPAEVAVEVNQSEEGEEKPLVISQAQAEQVRPAIEETSFGSNRFLWKMPSLHGLTPREAIQSLKGHHFQLEIRGAGLVQNQFPEEGRILVDGDTVRLRLAEPN
jgi:cell division protein FtsI (penicillin-binding protein 3)